jgi:hypothetical protein
MISKVLRCQENISVLARKALLYESTSTLCSCYPSEVTDPIKTHIRIEKVEGVVLCYFGVDDEETIAAMLTPSLLGYRATDDKNEFMCDGPRHEVIDVVSEYIGSIQEFTVADLIGRATTPK